MEQVGRKVQMREYMRKRRAEAKLNGVILASDSWAKDNPEKHRAKTRRWREADVERSRELTRRNQATRRSTPWGKITNRMWPTVHYGIKSGTTRKGKYNKVLGYIWPELKSHLESQFDEEMSWDNWGEVWEIDHIKPISSFRYCSINDPEFLECWGLQNMRPLTKEENVKKGCSC